MINLSVLFPMQVGSRRLKHNSYLYFFTASSSWNIRYHLQFIVCMILIICKAIFNERTLNFEHITQDFLYSLYRTSSWKSDFRFLIYYQKNFVPIFILFYIFIIPLGEISHTVCNVSYLSTKIPSGGTSRTVCTISNFSTKIKKLSSSFFRLFLGEKSDYECVKI